MIHHLDTSNFQPTIEQNETVLVDFYAEWCGPCRALHPSLEAISNEFGEKVLVSKIDIDKNPELAKQFSVRSIPALFYFRNGEVVDQHVGLLPKHEIERSLNTIIQ